MHTRREQVSNKNISVRSNGKRETFDSIERGRGRGREREREREREGGISPPRRINHRRNKAVRVGSRRAPSFPSWSNFAYIDPRKGEGWLNQLL